MQPGRQCCSRRVPGDAERRLHRGARMVGMVGLNGRCKPSSSRGRESGAVSRRTHSGSRVRYLGGRIDHASGPQPPGKLAGMALRAPGGLRLCLLASRDDDARGSRWVGSTTTTIQPITRTLTCVSRCASRAIKYSWSPGHGCGITSRPARTDSSKPFCSSAIRIDSSVNGRTRFDGRNLLGPLSLQHWYALRGAHAALPGGS